MERIRKIVSASISTKQSMLEDRKLLECIGMVSSEIIRCYRNKGKVLLCGNGGSAADAQHIAAELTGRFYKDREPLYAEALHVNTSYLTSVANDYSYDEVFSRMVKAAGKNGDILIGISTSGNSQNIIKAIEQANDMGLITVGLTGGKDGKLKSLCKYLIKISSTDTPRIQEAHILVGHILCEIVESGLFDN